MPNGVFRVFILLSVNYDFDSVVSIKHQIEFILPLSWNRLHELVFINLCLFSQNEQKNYIITILSILWFIPLYFSLYLSSFKLFCFYSAHWFVFTWINSGSCCKILVVLSLLLLYVISKLGYQSIWNIFLCIFSNTFSKSYTFSAIHMCVFIQFSMNYFEILMFLF